MHYNSGNISLNSPGARVSSNVKFPILAVKMTVQTYAVVRGILGFIFTLLIIATAYCYHDWVQVAFLFVLSVILYLILFAGVFVDTVLDMTRESIIDFILS